MDIINLLIQPYKYLNYYQIRKRSSISKMKEIKESLKLENVRYWNKEKTLSIEVSIHFGIYMDITKDAGSIPTEFLKKTCWAHQRHV